MLPIFTTGIAILGAGIFVKTQYIPRLAEISDLVNLKAIWSRSEESAKGAVEVARKHFPGVECKWGDEGLNEIIQDSSILGVAVVIAGQTQVEMSLKMLKVGKHVLQEKPAAASIAFVELKNLWKKLGYDERPTYYRGINEQFQSLLLKLLETKLGRWFHLGYGVHYIAGLRMLVGCEVTSVSATTSHVDKTLPAPDNITSNFQLENGCSGVFVMVVSSRSPKACNIMESRRIKGTVQLERGVQDGRHGYMATVYGEGGTSRTIFYPFSGVTEELKAFFNDISGASKEQEPRLSYVEGARDVAVLEAMLESGARNGAVIPVKKF
ncbi:hypothetical protein HID58_020454 [Brassica napus]|uniref:Gfo/Idh/MocA-like oxidoreductase N-terminal domain-containing protein n=1 Tax=Brassica napus TaxID=3708 RepID=A0ABQ7XGR9_BRANA|nr:hypothetical protein HID58_020454 [Brassica napus]